MSEADTLATTGLTIDAAPVSREAFNRTALDPAQSVVIEAAAGSGKTWLLVARILRALLAGSDSSSVLAITFTRKAAAEMRERLVRVLEELAACDDARAIALLTERGLTESEARALLPRARDLLESELTASPPMTVDTFHGWFARIVRSAPLAAGIPAGFAIAEKTGALMHGAWRRFLNEVSSDERLRAHYLELLARAESATTARRLLDAMVKRRNDWKRFLTGHGAGNDIGVAVAALARELEVDERELDGPDARASLFDDPEFAARYEAVLDLFDCGTTTDRAYVAKGRAALRARDFDGVHLPFATQNRDLRQQSNAVKAAALARHGIDGELQFAADAQQLLHALNQASQRQIERDVLAINRAAFHCGAAYIAAYEAIKLEQALLDFDDLEWHAAALMSDDTSAAYVQARLDARYRHILVDEFQDTNPLQWMVLKRWLTIYTEDADLAEARPSVFIVGDPKQSIYRFRRAEPLLFDAARAFLRNDYGAAVLGTDETRRIAPALMSTLNQAFDRKEFPLFRPHRSASHAPGQALRLPLIGRLVVKKATKADDGDTPLVLRDVLTTPRAEEPQDLHDIEARAIVDALRAIVGSRKIDDPHHGSRLARWGDVMVLVRKRKRIEAIETALRAHRIPYASARRGGLLETLEASDLCALLQVLVAPFSDLALAQALRSPLFGCSDDDLIRLAALSREPPLDRYPHWWSRLEAVAAQGEVPALMRAHRLLAAWREAAATLPAHDLLDRIVHEGEWITRTAAATVPEMREQVRANLYAYLELALAQDSGRFPSLPRFIDELVALSRIEDDAPDEGDAEADAADAEADREEVEAHGAGRGDAVRILTVHGAKGLEAPIVVIADGHPAKQNKPFNNVLIAWPPDSDAPLHLSVFGKVAERGRARDRHFEREEEHAAREDWNVLYVAATRAREVLLVAGCTPGASEDDDSWYRRLGSLPEWSPRGGDMTNDAANAAMNAAMNDAMNDATNDATFESIRAPAPEASLRAPVFRPPVLSIGVRRALDGENDFDGADDGQAQRIGIALHRVLEQHGRDAAGRGFDRAQAAAIAMHFGLSASAAAMVAERASRMLAAPDLQRFFVPAQHVAASDELELLAADGRLMRIDRLVEFAAAEGPDRETDEEADGETDGETDGEADRAGKPEVWVLDYKSRHRDVEGEVPQAYVEQLTRYRRAVVALYPRHSVRSALIFGDGGLLELSDRD